MLLSFMTACSKSDVPEGYQLANCEGDTFRLYVPTQGWILNTASGISGAYFSVTENIWINAYEVDDADEMSIEEYWSYCDAKYTESFDEYSSEPKSEKCVLGGRPAQKNIYSAKITLADGENVRTSVQKYMQITAQNEGRTYLLVYSAPEEHFDTYREVFEGNADDAGVISHFTFASPYKSEDEKKYSEKADVPDGMKLISTDEVGYRFFAPEGWTVNQRTDFPAAYLPDGANVSLQVYMLNLENDDSLNTPEKYFESCKVRYEDIFDSFTINDEKDIKMAGAGAKQYIYTVVSGGVEYRQLQAIVFRGAYYVFTYTSEADAFDAHLDDVQAMIENFKMR
jgi:hypothetical protein